MAKYKLGDICTIVSGSTPKTGIEEYWKGNLKWITPAEIEEDTYIISDSERKITELAVKKTGLSSFPKGTVILSSRAPIGKVAIAGCEMYCNQGFKNLICSEKINNKYLYWFLKRNTKYLNSLGRGATFKEISKTIVSEIEINLPEYRKQEKISNELEKINKIIGCRKQELKLFEDLVKARFVELFGDPVSNSKGLKELTLPELGELGRGVSKHRPRNAPELLGGEYPLIQTGEVSNAGLYIENYENTYSELGYKQSKMWKAGTLCITIAANIAKTAILKFDACFPDSVVGFKANDKTNEIFIHYWFSFFQAILEAQAPESAQKNINLKILSELKVIAPDIEEQNKFATFVVQVNKSKFATFVVQVNKSKLPQELCTILQENSLYKLVKVL